MEYIKHFNQHSANYQSYRPTYPASLFDFLTTLVPKPDIVWDCGTGTGQAAYALAQRFPYVVGTDLNLAPLEVGLQSDRIAYLCCSAEKTCFLSHSISLITIAQALHWFDLDKFYTEVRRVGNASAVIAAWCYSLGKIEANLDLIINRLYEDILGDEYWPQERRYIDECYQTIAFPFKKISTPDFTIEKQLSLADFVGYLNTWSAVKEYQVRNHTNPIDLIIDELSTMWGDPFLEKRVVWEIHLLAGRIV